MPDHPQEWTSTELVERIQADELGAKTEFYRRFNCGMRYFALRMRVEPALADDLVQEVIYLAMRQIQAGQPRDPETLPGYVRTILRRHIQEHWEVSKRFDQLEPGNITLRELRPNPEQQVLIAEKAVIMRRALAYLSVFHVELLTRFYLHGQKEEQIRAEMSVSGNVFRIEKSRAKLKMTEAVQQITQGKTPKRYREFAAREWRKAA